MNQSNLFTPWGETIAAQRELFPREDRSSSLRCCECQEHLVRTASGFLACPRGHGRLLCESGFDTTPDDE